MLKIRNSRDFPKAFSDGAIGAGEVCVPVARIVASDRDRVRGSARLGVLIWPR